MSVETWGQLDKSQVDSEKIEAAVVRLIVEHEADPDSHLDVGESLQSHRASEIIDHLAMSIVEDKIKDNEVSTNKIKDLAVATGKIANLAVDEGKIASLAVTNAKIANLAVDDAKIGNISADKITTGVLVGRDIKTASSGRRVALQASAGGDQHTLIFYDSSGNAIAKLFESSNALKLFLTAPFKIGGGVYPDTDGGYSLGASNARWGSGYFYSILQIDQNFIVNGYLVLNNARQLQNIASADIDGPANFAGHITIDGNAFLNLRAMSGAVASGLTPQNGSMYYRTDDHVIRVYLNGAWKTITTS